MKIINFFKAIFTRSKVWRVKYARGTESLPMSFSDVANHHSTFGGRIFIDYKLFITPTP